MSASYYEIIQAPDVDLGETLDGPFTIVGKFEDMSAVRDIQVQEEEEPRVAASSHRSAGINVLTGSIIEKMVYFQTVDDVTLGTQTSVGRLMNRGGDHCATRT